MTSTGAGLHRERRRDDDVRIEDRVHLVQPVSIEPALEKREESHQVL